MMVGIMLCVHTSKGEVLQKLVEYNMDLTIFEKNSEILRKNWDFLFLILSSPSHHVGSLIWSLSNFTKAQGILLNLHGPPNGPQNGPCEANFWGPFIKKAPAGALHGQN